MTEQLRRAQVDPQSPLQGYQHLQVRPLTLTIGAEIEGPVLRDVLTAPVVAEIRRALLDWKVIFFRNQHLDHAAHVGFARQFGRPTIGHPVFGHDPEFPEIYSIAKVRTALRHREAQAVTPWTGWHTDITAAINPPMASILRGVTIPPFGGDTQWTDLAAAYRGFSEPLQEFLRGLRAVHAFSAPPPAVNGGVKGGDDYEFSIRNRKMISEHPVITVHPETGEHVLYVNPQFTKSIVGLSRHESRALLELLWRQIIRPEFTVRFKWNAGDVAFWDNRATAHLAPVDIFATEWDRQLYRITLTGVSPVGVDGVPSVAIEGEPILPVEEELLLRH